MEKVTRHTLAYISLKKKKKDYHFSLLNCEPQKTKILNFEGDQFFFPFLPLHQVKKSLASRKIFICLSFEDTILYFSSWNGNEERWLQVVWTLLAPVTISIIAIILICPTTAKWCIKQIVPSMEESFNQIMEKFQVVLSQIRQWRKLRSARVQLRPHQTCMLLFLFC